jgi:transcription elongation factor Elf1
MEYIGNCPVCKHHTIIKTVKEIVHDKKRRPQRKVKCLNCGNLTRITIIGEIEKVFSEMKSPTPEFSTHNRLLIKFWIAPD